MTTPNLPQPPSVREARFDDWLFRLWEYVKGLDSTTSTGTVTSTPTAHSSLSGLNTSEYTHLSGINAGDLTDGGDSSLHFHSADRDRANHTGTQPAASISDFTSAVQAANTQENPALMAQVFAPRHSMPNLGNASAILQGQIFGG